MFNSLSYAVTFSETGRTLSADVTFEKGMTAVYGPNESGKSFMLEMMRFLLWGSAALRGTSDTYAKLNVSGEFTIRNQAYRVERTLKKASLFWLSGGEPELVASSTSAVNEKIVSIFGFGLPVFDVACAANQGDLRKLTEMRPTERKRMVDTVIGVGMLEAVGKWAREEANLHNKMVERIEPSLVRPTEPVQPLNFRPVSEVREQLQAAHSASREAASIEGMLAVQPQLPKKPSCTVPMPASTLKPMADNRRQARADLALQKSTLAKMPSGVRYTTGQLKQMEVDNGLHQAWLEAQRWIMANPPPTEKLDDIEKDILTWVVIDQLKAIDRDIERLSRDLEKDKTTCPACEHSWHSDAEHAQRTQERLSAARARRLEYCSTDDPSEPTRRLEELQKLKRTISGFNYEKHSEMLAVQPVEKPALTNSEIRIELINNQLFDKRGEVEARIAQLEGELRGPNIEEQYEIRARFERDMEHYENQLKAHMDELKRRQDAAVRLSALQPVALTVPLLEEELQRATIYESEKKSYDQQKVVYDKGVAEVEELKRLVDQYRKITSAMNTLRTRIKQYLLPSLNRVASNLLSRMTAGSRNSIVVDDDFEIIVDGQKVEGLSGSGLDCTNLALRVALGQVLVSSVFSVFLADEIDGAMDPVRAKETSVTLRNLAKAVSQIVVVSHKSIEADHEIVLGEINGPTDQFGTAADS